MPLVPRPIPLATIADRLRWVLETRETSARALSLAAGLSQSAVSLILAGRYEPKGASVLALSEAGGVSPAWLMWGMGPREPGELAR